MTDQEQQDFLNSLKARVDRGEKLNEQEKFIYDLEMEDVGDPLSTKPTVTIPVIVCLGSKLFLASWCGSNCFQLKDLLLLQILRSTL